MYHLVAIHVLCKSRDVIALWWPGIDGMGGRAYRRLENALRVYAAKQVLIAGHEVVIVYEPLFQLVGHSKWLCGEILPCQHVVAHLKVRATDGEHHGIGKERTGSVDILVGKVPGMVSLVEVDVGCIYRLQAMVALLVVGLYYFIEAFKRRLGVPHLVITEVDSPGTVVEFGIADVVGTVATYAVHDKPLVFAVTLHRLEKQTVVVLKVYHIAVFLEHVTTSTKLIDLIAVEVVVGINLSVAVHQIVLPVVVAGVHEVDITLPV